MKEQIVTAGHSGLNTKEKMLKGEDLLGRKTSETGLNAIV